MNPLPAELVARWLPDWRAFAEAALQAAQAPKGEPVQLAAMAERADKWPTPFGQKRDQYVGAMLIWAAKAFCRQDSAVMRETLAGALLETALAFKGRLERAARSLKEPIAPSPATATASQVLDFQQRRRRRDIDDVDDEPAGEG
jgi:hypothetical protein